MSRYRYQLEAFVDKVKGRTPQYWLPADDAVSNMTWIEKVYEKVCLITQMSCILVYKHGRIGRLVWAADRGRLSSCPFYELFFCQGEKVLFQRWGTAGGLYAIFYGIPFVVAALVFIFLRQLATSHLLLVLFTFLLPYGAIRLALSILRQNRSLLIALLRS